MRYILYIRNVIVELSLYLYHRKLEQERRWDPRDEDHGRIKGKVIVVSLAYDESEGQAYNSLCFGDSRNPCTLDAIMTRHHSTKR